jgi:hypothetical protein
LSGGEESDAKNGWLLLNSIGRMKDPDEERPLYLLMDRAHEDWDTRWLAFEWGYSPEGAPQKNRKKLWKYDTERYKPRNEGERIFRRLKGLRRIGTGYDKLEGMFSAFIYLALCVIAVGSLLPRCVNTP